MLLLVFSALIFIQAFSENNGAQFESLYSSNAVNINEFADRFCERLSNFIIKHDLDPYFTSKDIHQPFWLNILSMHVTGSVNLRNITVRGLSSIKRVNNKDATLKYVDRTLTLRVTAVVDTLLADSVYDARVIGLNPNGQIHFIDRGQAVSLGIKVNFTSLKAHLLDLSLHDSDYMDVSITHLGIFGSIFDNLVSFFQDSILKLSSDLLKKTINSYLDGMPPLLPPLPKQDSTLWLSSFPLP